MAAADRAVEMLGKAVERAVEKAETRMATFSTTVTATMQKWGGR